MIFFHKDYKLSDKPQRPLGRTDLFLERLVGTSHRLPIASAVVGASSLTLAFMLSGSWFDADKADKACAASFVASTMPTPKTTQTSDGWTIEWPQQTKVIDADMMANCVASKERRSDLAHKAFDFTTISIGLLALFLAANQDLAVIRRRKIAAAKSLRVEGP